VRAPALALALLAVAWPTTALPSGAAEVASWLDTAADALEVRSSGGRLGARLDGDASLALYTVDDRAPGLLQARGGPLAAPRLSLAVSAFWGDVVLDGLARVDRGFDPGQRDAEARMDAYTLRWTPGPWLSASVGKRPTGFGAWAPRHRSWENPLVTAPLPYDQVTTVSDGDAPTSPAAFLARRALYDRKARWVPMVWGPSYTSGVSASGRAGRLEWSAEVRNRALSSRPETWGFQDTGLRAPTVSGRLGAVPAPAWRIGASASHGPYLRDTAATTLPPGRDVEHYGQTIVGADASWAHGPWEVWSELVLSRFDVPNVGDADVLGWYVEGKRKLGARFWAAARFGQLLFGEVPDGRGGEARWDDDRWRLDLGVGARWHRLVVTKLAYQLNHSAGPITQGEQMVSVEAVVRF
jgi:hypothetical protein